MKRIFLAFVVGSQLLFSQNVANQLDQSTQKLLNSTGAYSANLSFYVTDDNGNLVYEYQPNKGLSTASTQKIFTAAAALETLGKDYRYTTTASYSGQIKNGILEGDLWISSNGDPTLGSWRYEDYKPEKFKEKLLQALQQKNIKSITGNIIIDDSYFDFQSVPGGWPWDDIGNYYGAGTWGINWRENQFDINTNGTQFKSFSYDLENVKWINELKASGSSDQSLIFTAPHSDVALINGSLPAGKSMTVSGSVPNPPLQLGVEVKSFLNSKNIAVHGNVETYYNNQLSGKKMTSYPEKNNFFEYQSPTLDKMVYWFLRKSINFYGETFVKTMAKEKKGNSSYKVGVQFLKDFWKSKGINPSMINFADGSGLSPQNYVSAKAEVQALLYAQKQPWFSDYFDGFPPQNAMKMKSGTIRNIKSFAGYHTSKSGKKYVFSIILNNYQSADISQALFKVLDNLK
ncbi:D-alanyl-D-alanine carboxypeptidase/D-alanyl-D-alanine endopeptidase [Soonwooa purpurea]